MGLGPEIEALLGPVKWHRAVSRVPFEAQKIRQHKIGLKYSYRVIYCLGSVKKEPTGVNTLQYELSVQNNVQNSSSA
jgi:hypothetical protein